MRCVRLAAFIVAAPAMLRAQQTVDKHWALNADGAVRMYNFLGSLRVVGWDKDSVVVTGTLSPGLSFFGGGPREGVKLGVNGEQSQPAQSADLVIYLPARARISIRGAATEIDVSAIAGEVDVATTSGRIGIQGTPSEVQAESMSGDVEINASPAHLRAKDATGRISWSGSSEDVALSTVSGRMIINGGVVSRARFESIDGDIRFTGAVSPKASVSFDTHGGNVTLVLPKGSNVETQVTAATGDVFGSRFVSTDATRGSVNVHRLGKGGPGRATIVVRSFKGRVVATLQ